MTTGEVPNWKSRCSWAAECVNEWRMIPKALTIGYGFFVYELTHKLLDWYMLLPAAERSMEASGMAVGIFTAATGFGSAIFNLYMKGEKKTED